MLAFIIAMQNEADALLSLSRILSEKVVCDKKVYTAEYCGTEYLLVVGGVGKVNIAAATQIAVSVYGADKIVNFGLSGSLRPEIPVAEVFEVSHAVQYDFDLAQLNGTPVGTLNEYEEPYLPLDRTHLFPAVKLGTGDRFNDSEADFRFLHDTLLADVRDMEGAAIVQVCKHANVPVYAYKVISDVAGSGSTTEQYLANTARAVQNFQASLPTIFAAFREEA